MEKIKLTLFIIRNRLLSDRIIVRSLIQTFILLILLAAGIYLLNRHVPSWDSIFVSLTQYPVLMYAAFFVSESTFGFLPPDLFILWTLKFKGFFIYLTILSILSYIGGIVAFLIGKMGRSHKRLQRLTDTIYNKYGRYIMKWGGIGVIIAAITPLPFSPISMLCGSLNYPLKSYLQYSSVRFIRFFFYGWLFWKIYGM